MATAARARDYRYIVKTQGVRAGKARIDGTRICVVDIALLAKQGMRPEEVATHFASRPLTLAEVHAALAYHYDHPEELEAYLRSSDEMLGQLEAKSGHSRRGSSR
jgi:uncharacterized protein (DUF433 family)